MNDTVRLIYGEARAGIRSLAARCIKCCITSPPYWGLSDYPLEPVEWFDGLHTLGKEPSYDSYAMHLLEVLECVWPKLTDDGTVWLTVKDDDHRLEKVFEAKDVIRGVVDLGSERIYCLAYERRLNAMYAQEAFIACYDALAKKHDLFQPYVGYRFGKTPRSIAIPIIEAATKPGDVLLDPFAGVGTLGLFAMETGRKAVLVELDPAAMAIAQVRIQRGL